ncbi:probable transcription-associated protein 1 [Coccomyxa sp. Obi]|nr:probable transcription-associated protein 1 [Coccomyxa sp. Obi]
MTKMLSSSDFEGLAQALQAPDAGVEQQLARVTEIRESIELVHTQEYGIFLRHFMVPFLNLLQTVPPSFKDNTEHKLRNVVLEILNRLPHNDLLRPHSNALMQAALNVLNTDNEENGLLCLRITFDLHKAFRPSLEDLVPPFMEFVKKVFEGVGSSYKNYFDPGPEGRQMQEIIPTTQSFKIVAETPIQVMFLINLYSRSVNRYVPVLAPLMVNAVSLPGLPANVQQDNKLKAIASDFRNAQVKILSFLTYLLRQFQQLIQPHQDSISTSLVRALQACPDSVPMRRELLIATRHVLTTSVRGGFLSELDTLLKEETLVGRGRQCQTELRPLAFSMLAELVHHVRQDLTFAHLSRVIYLFARNLHDSTLPVSVECTSVRLLLNLVEVVFARRADIRSAEAHRALLAGILDAFTAKLSSLHHRLPQLLSYVAEKEASQKNADTEAKAGESTAPSKEAAEAVPASSGAPPPAPAAAAAAPEGAQGVEGSSPGAQMPKAGGTDGAEDQPEKPPDFNRKKVLYIQERSEHEKQVSDAKLILSTLIMGMKTLLYSITNYGNTNPNLAAPGTPQLPSVGLREAEIRLATRTIKRGLPCLQLFPTGPDPRAHDRHADIYDSFADMFTVLSNPRDVIEVFSLQMPRFFDAIIENPRLLRVVGTLFASPPIGPPFAQVLLHTVVHDRLSTLDDPLSKEGELTLKLLNLFLDALTKFPALEGVLVPFFHELVSKTLARLRNATAKEGYLDLLLSLFRAISMLRQQGVPGGPVASGEALCAIFTGSGVTTSPLLVPTIDTLTALLEGPRSNPYRNALLELLLIMPCRLSEILSVLGRLMAPLVSALSGNEALVTLSIRTLEYWVDSLNPEFLEPAMLPVIPQLMRALWSHLRPLPYNFSAKALALLGKLGGRNRRFLKDPLELDLKDNPEHGLRLILTFQPSTSFLVPLDRCLALSSQSLLSPTSKQNAHEKREALRFLHICLASVLNLRSPDDSELPGSSMDKLTSMLFGNQPPPHIEPTPAVTEMGVKTKTQLLAERQVLRQLITSVIAASSDKDLQPQGTEYTLGVCRHFALLFAAGASAPLPSVAAGGEASRTGKVSSLKELDPYLFLDALVEVLSEEDADRVNAAVKGIEAFVDTLMLVTETQDKLCRRSGAEEAAPPSDDAPADPMGVDDAPSVQGKVENGAVAEAASEHGAAGPQKENGANTSSPKRPTVSSIEGSWPAALDELLDRVLHCCYGDAWATRIGGLAAVGLLAKKLPVVQLRARLPLCVRALLTVMRGLPDHAISQVQELRDTLTGLLNRCIIEGRPLPTPAQARSFCAEPKTSAQPAAAEGASGQEQAPADEATDKAAAAGSDTPMPDAKEPEQPAGTAPSAAAAGEGSASGEDVPAPGLKRMSSSISADVAMGASDEISPRGSEKDGGSDKAASAEPLDEGTDRTLQGVVQVVSHELLSPRSSEALRKLADECLKIVCKASGRTSAQLLKPLLEKLSPPLEKRRLMPLKHASLQIGNAAAFTYCMQQRPPLLPLSQEVVMVISDAYMLSEMDDASMATQLAALQRVAGDTTKVAEQLRSVCLSMLCAAMQWDDFRDSGDLAELRGRIIQIFFKHLTSSNDVAVSMSQEGLAAVIAHQKMPKHLLQTSLRPILVNLAYYNKLKLPLLRGLARLLNLLASWFNVTLGEKLIDHLKKWLEPEKLLSVTHSWEAGQECHIAAAILDLFHLLPPPAVKFLETGERPGLVVLMIELEGALAQMPSNTEPTKMWSPYREPLAKFLNKYPEEAVAYFLDANRMGNPSYINRFIDILRSPLGRPLLNQLAASSDKLAALLYFPPGPANPAEAPAPPVPQAQLDAHFHAVHLIAIVAKLLPDWLPQSLFDLLLRQWNSPERHSRVEDEERLERAQLYESKRLAKALLSYLSRHHDLVGPLFDLLDIFTVRTRVDFAFLKDYYKTTVAQTYTLEEKRQILRHFLEVFQAQSRPQDQLVQAASLLVLPMLEAGYEAGQAIVDDDALTTMVTIMFDPPDDLASAYGEGMKMELLQLATLLIRRAPQQLVQHRKELIKFGWNHLKRDDSAAKYYAFLNVCHFLDAYQAPEKIVLQVFVALLRTCQPDGRRVLVRQALDTLTPALVRRLAPGDARYPIWVRYTKKVLVEEGHSMPHLIHIWQLIVRHADLFYSSRTQFMTQMVNGLMKLGLPQNASLENRRLSLDLAGLVVHWEQRRIADAEAAPAAAAQAQPLSLKRRREDGSGIPTEIKEEVEATEEGRPAKQARVEGVPSDGQATPEQQAAQQPAGPDASGSAGAAANAAAEAQVLADVDPALAQARSASGDEDCKLTPTMQEMVLVFIIRMAFLLGDGHKEPEYLTLHKHTLTLFGEALALWPNVPVKINFINKLLESNIAHNLDPPPALVTGLKLMQRALAVQPTMFIQVSHQALVYVLEPAFTSSHHTVITLLCDTLETLYKEFYVQKNSENPNIPAQVSEVNQRVHEIMQHHLTAACNPGMPLSPAAPPGLLGVCASLRVLTTLEPYAPEYVARFTPLLVKLLNRVARDHASPGGLVLDPTRQPRGPREGGEMGEPEYGTLTWATLAALKLSANKVLFQAERKKLFLQTLVLLITGNAAKHTDPAILMGILTIVRSWLLQPIIHTAPNKPPEAVSLTEKEAILFLQRLASLARNGWMRGPLQQRWETTFLEMIHSLCTATNLPQGDGLRVDVFDKVERVFLLGLRASDPAMRRKFFDLYNSAIPVTLYDRLRFIVCIQDWEHLADTFWLKQGLDLVLAVLVEKEPIKLAPNSAQIPALLAQTKQNIFHLKPHQTPTTQQGQPQQQQQMPPAGPQPAPGAAINANQPSADGAAAAPGEDGPKPQLAPAVAAPDASQPAPKIEPGTDAAAQAQPMDTDVKPGEPPQQPSVPVAAPAGPALPVSVPGQVPPGGAPSPLPVPKAEPAAPAVMGPQQSDAAVQQPNGVLPAGAGPPGPPGPAAAAQPGSVAPGVPSGSGDMAPPPPVPQGLPTTHSGNVQLPMLLSTQSGLSNAGGNAGVQLPPWPQLPGPPPDGAEAAERPAEVEVRGIEAPKVPAGPMLRETTAALDIPDAVDELMREHLRFLYKEGSYEVQDMVSTVTEVAHGDAHMASHLWVLVFPIVWATLSEKKEQQIQLAKPIIHLLSKEYHLRQSQQRPNVVQALLEGISLSQPQPKIPSELIKFLGKTYNAWHIAIPLLESHVMLFPTETRCFDALAELYSMLNEEDVLFGLWKRRGVADETRAALSCIQHGLLQPGQDHLLDAIRRADANQFPPMSADGRGGPSKGEQAQWTKQYLACAAELSQWEVVAEYASVTENYAQMAECLWRLHDWMRLKDIVLPKAMVEDTPQSEMIRTYVKLQEGDIIEGDKHTSAGIGKALEKWWQLPEVGVWPQLQQLACFQRLVELTESTRILMDLGQPQQNHQYSELKDILETWRLRTPNEWESLGTWADVLTWRNAIYNVVINAFKNVGDMAPHLHQLGYRDKAWSVNRLAAIARKHDCPEVCKNIIATQYGFNAMEVQEAFVKIREQAQAFLDQPDQLIAGLNLLSSQNLDYFQTPHQAELFRLEGLFHRALGDPEAANRAFSTSLALWPQLAAGWLSWGDFCDNRAKANAGGANWLENAVVCYMQAIRHGSAPARAMMPRILTLFSFHDSSGAVTQAIRKNSRQVPLNVWLPWLPQLQTSLQRPEAALVKDLLAQLATTYPQAVYYGLRTILLSLREAAVKAVQEARQAARTSSGGMPATPSLLADQPQPSASAASTGALPGGGPTASFSSGGAGGAVSGAGHAANGVDADSAKEVKSSGNVVDSEPTAGEGAKGTADGSSPNGQVVKPLEKPPEVVAFEAGKEIMDLLRSKHPHSTGALELMMSEIGTRFVPKAEERLLAVVHALLHRCYKMPFSNNAEVPASLKKELSGVCKACFSNEHMARHGRLMGEYRDQFVRDLDPASSGWPATLGELSGRLKAWRATLQSTVEDSMPPHLRLEDEARNLQEQAFTDVEMPGQYLGGAEVAPEAVVFLERIGSNVGIVRRHATSYRRLALHGSDGKTVHFLVQTGQHWSNTSGAADERMMQLLRNMNRLLDKHPQSRRRHLAWHTPIIVPVYPQVRLVEEELSYCSYGEAYEVNCARYGREADMPIAHFKKRCCSPSGNLISDPNGEIRLQAYHEIETRLVTETVFSQYMYKTLPTSNHLWAFKKQFCTQMALSGLLSHMLLIGGRTPYKILFARASGKTFQIDFYPVYDQRGMLERSEPVPFRLTRNLHTFFTPFGVEGVFVSAMAAAAQAVLGTNSNLADLLALFFRDDITAWSQRRQQRGGAWRHPQLKQLVDHNIDQCLKRMAHVAPSRPQEGVPASVQRGAQELVESALNPRNLCRMDPTWHPWF